MASKRDESVISEFLKDHPGVSSWETSFGTGFGRDYVKASKAWRKESEKRNRKIERILLRKKDASAEYVSKKTGLDPNQIGRSLAWRRRDPLWDLSRFDGQERLKSKKTKKTPVVGSNYSSLYKVIGSWKILYVVADSIGDAESRYKQHLSDLGIRKSDRGINSIEFVCDSSGWLY